MHGCGRLTKWSNSIASRSLQIHTDASKCLQGLTPLLSCLHSPFLPPSDMSDRSRHLPPLPQPGRNGAPRHYTSRDQRFHRSFHDQFDYAESNPDIAIPLFILGTATQEALRRDQRRYGRHTRTGRHVRRRLPISNFDRAVAILSGVLRRTGRYTVLARLAPPQVLEVDE